MKRTVEATTARNEAWEISIDDNMLRRELAVMTRMG